MVGRLNIFVLHGTPHPFGRCYPSGDLAAAVETLCAVHSRLFVCGICIDDGIAHLSARRLGALTRPIRSTLPRRARIRIGHAGQISIHRTGCTASQIKPVVGAVPSASGVPSCDRPAAQLTSLTCYVCASSRATPVTRRVLPARARAGAARGHRCVYSVHRSITSKMEWGGQIQTFVTHPFREILG